MAKTDPKPSHDPGSCTQGIHCLQCHPYGSPGSRIRGAMDKLRDIERAVRDESCGEHPEIILRRIDNVVHLYCAFDVSRAVANTGPV